jgi:hypothetical protein
MKLIRILLLALLAFNSPVYADAINDSNASSRLDARDRISSRSDIRNDGSSSDSNADDARRQKPEPLRNAGIQKCYGEFALCASSTCKLTGKKISVKTADGKGSRDYPEVVCKCPIITNAIADANGKELAGLAGVNQGNMKGSCAVPGPDKIWSLFSHLTNYPQESATPPFVRGDDQNTFKQYTCTSGTGSNCWSFLCTRDKALTNGTRTATCSCPAGENPFGAPTKNSEFLIGAGSQYTSAQGGQQAACSQYPVSIPNIKDLNEAMQ